ncbi:glutathione S-transferase C-terminal domain-containing protein [Actinoplanes sp. N902-109]|uniref:glutathione S-transferase C-terminal domain-containing protein n=1 Tax=Actinoplanes sp. (strain N902-109) TaxID=649831 RepID=UPI0003295905|nr:glutathione S-transferase C-terminal domain-containing protein [Actinoplanes sp. N902-109]AGL17929.1 glutathione S-transferase domain protein [Actinoplanes sp. N902-109]
MGNLQLASPVDTERFGVYRVPATPGALTSRTGRITRDGEFAAEAGRYHLYGGWFCPWWQRVAIARALAGLADVVSMSFVDGARDGRGWAFRESHGADPVNGFTLLRQAYEASEPDFAGHVSVPALWDRSTGRLVSNDAPAMEVDLATCFGHLATATADLYPAALRTAIDDLDAWLGPIVNGGLTPANRDTVLATFRSLDDRLAGSRFLLGGAAPTLADIRLFVRLVRYDTGPNATRAITPALDTFPHLWAYARDLYTIPAFHDTTDFAAFSEPGAARLDWGAPAGR